MTPYGRPEGKQKKNDGIIAARVTAAIAPIDRHFLASIDRRRHGCV